MTEGLKSSIRLALYAVWITLSIVLVWIAATQVGSSPDSGPGFSFSPDGPRIMIAVPSLVVGIVSLVSATILATRSALLSNRAARDAARA